MITRIKKICFHIYIREFAFLVVLSAAWWGLLYPNFSLGEDTFQLSEEEAESGLSPAGEFFSMLDAEPGEIEVKSRFWEIITDIRGNEDE